MTHTYKQTHPELYEAICREFPMLLKLYSDGNCGENLSIKWQVLGTRLKLFCNDLENPNWYYYVIDVNDITKSHGAHAERNAVRKYNYLDIPSCINLLQLIRSQL
jgi:hypothetical protein